MGEVGPEFILSPEHRPKPNSIEADNIPLIDLSNPNLEILVAEIRNACKNWGFFQVINHGVPSKCREKIESASKKFFSLPKEEKMELSRDETNPYGYYDTEHTKNVRDWKEILDCTAQNPAILPSSHLLDDTELKEFNNKWPPALPELREAVEEFAAEMEKLAFKLLELLAMSLGLKKDRLNGYFNDQTSRVKLNYYPPCPVPHLALGTGRHKDGGALTILAQDDVGGLEVKRQADGEWILVKPIHDSYVINVGDMIQVWSNEEYKSIEHRATVNSEKERFSIPYFFNPAHDTWVEPLKELVNEDNPPRYRGYNWGKFIVTRNRAEIQNHLQISSTTQVSAMGEVDVAFIQELEHRPKPETVEADNIPLIDLSPLSTPGSDPGALEGLVAKIGDACKNWGFFQVINHDVPLHFRQSIELISREFFALSKDEKKKVARDEVKPTGYYDTEHTKNVRDWKEVFDFTVKEPMIIPASHELHDDEVKQVWNQWPQNPPRMKEVCLQYAAEMEKLGYKLLELIALSLGLERDRFKGFFEDHTTFIRLNHYPPCPISDLALGVGRHKDAGALTILAQDDVGGLQVKRKSDGEWILVKPTPNAYIINVGDIIQVWSNDKYESVEHRVKVNAERERFSTPYFMNPAHDAMVEPLEELVDEQNPAKYKAYSWGKFFTNRKRSNFKKLDVENVQIYHFKN